jgi:PTH1 family peptidyl-tRNA hydrolase
MNRSGESVAAALAELPVGDLASDFAVVIDDLDLPFGRIRIRPSGGAGGHRGLESLIEHLDTRVFPRLRFGIGRPGPDEDPVNHVLSAFSRSEEERLGARIDAAVAALETLLREGVSAAMNQFNHSPEPASAPPDA